MSKETIYREDAINAIRSTVAQYVPFLNGINMTLPLECETALRSVPSADRPQGEWEIVGKNHPYKRCPFCKRVRAFTDTRFCDWCGARMKGADDD